MFTYLVFAVFLVAAVSANLHDRGYYEQRFFDHIQQFKLKLESGRDFVQRLQIFADNSDIIEKHNADGKQTFKMGHNQFSHMTFAEFLDAVHIGGTRAPNLRRTNKYGSVHPAPQSGAALADSVDWTTQGAVTDVKDQGSCGSCWSFSATGALEGAYYLKYGSLKAFSEQELVSCDTGGADAGCNGGWMDDAFDFVKSNGGLATEDDYPYTSGSSGKSGSCVSTGYTNVAEVAPTSYTDVATGDVSALMSAVSQQPVSIAIQANQLAFQFYSTGVLTGKCGQNLDHGVLLVGYGTDSATGTDYWKVKNSWSSSWGEGGYIRIERSDDDLCGVLDAPSYPNL